MGPHDGHEQHDGHAHHHAHADHDEHAGHDKHAGHSVAMFRRKMLQNLWWAAGYNIIAIPLAAGLLAPWGFVLSPAVGAVLMSLSTVIVALNAQLLRRTETGQGSSATTGY